MRMRALPLARVTLNLAGALSGWLLVAGALLAAGAILLFYRSQRKTLEPGALAALALLRSLAALLVLLAIFQPTIGCDRARGERSRLAVLLDASESMRIADHADLPGRLERAIDLFSRRGGGWLDRLGEDFDVRVYAFDASLRPIEPDALDRLAADGVGTAVGKALDTAAERLGGAGGETVLLLSDGIDNTGGDPVAVAREGAVRVHAIGVGTRLMAEKGFQDVVLSDVRTKRFAAVGDVAEVKAYVDAAGYGATRVRVVLLEGERELASEDLVLDDHRGDQVVRLRFTPQRLVTMKCRVRVDVQPGERIGDNNEGPVTLAVKEPQVRVLYVDDARPEYRFLHRALGADPNLDVLGLYRPRPGLFVQQGEVAGVKLEGLPDSAEVLAKFDVIVLGDLERGAFTDAELALVRGAVEKGAGLLALGGRFPFGKSGWAGSPLAEVLPVALAPGEGRAASYRPRLTAAGREADVLTGCAKFFEPDAERLPPLTGLSPVRGARAAAEVWLEEPGAGAPVLVAGAFGRGRSAVFLGTPTWRWALTLRSLGAESPYGRLWGQLVRWLAHQDAAPRSAGPGVVAFSGKESYRPAERVTLHARVRGESGAPESDAVVAAVIRGPGGETQRLSLARGEEPGDYRASFTPEAPGEYAFTIAATLGEERLGEAADVFSVGRRKIEFERLDLDERLLGRLARATGGRYAPLTAAGALLESLRAEAIARRRRVEIEVWNAPAAFLLFLGLVTAEWILRKRLHLS